jgi:hypothetical protein
VAEVEIYAPSDEGPLRQGEILTDLVQIQLKTDELNRYPLDENEEHPLLRCDHRIAIVATQDCDLDWDYKDRRNGSGPKLIPNVLFCEVVSAGQLRSRQDIKSDIWRRIRTNKNERYQFLEKVAPQQDALGEGLPEMALDFKRCFSMPTGEVYLQVGCQAKRRCRLVSPYLEHLSHRLFSFHARVALPAEHFSEPAQPRS